MKPLRWLERERIVFFININRVARPELRKEFSPVSIQSFTALKGHVSAGGAIFQSFGEKVAAEIQKSPKKLGLFRDKVMETNATGQNRRSCGDQWKQFSEGLRLLPSSLRGNPLFDADDILAGRIVDLQTKTLEIAFGLAERLEHFLFLSRD